MSAVVPFSEIVSIARWRSGCAAWIAAGVAGSESTFELGGRELVKEGGGDGRWMTRTGVDKVCAEGFDEIKILGRRGGDNGVATSFGQLNSVVSDAGRSSPNQEGGLRGDGGGRVRKLLSGVERLESGVFRGR